MDRVDKAGLWSWNTPPGDRKAEKPKAGEKTRSFQRLFQKDPPASESVGPGLMPTDEASLAAALDEIHSLGEELLARPSPEKVARYRQRIGTFLRSIVRESYETEEHEGRLRKDLQRPKYTLLQRVNEKLDRLAAALLSSQRDQIDLLRRTEELYGLLVDLIS